MPVENSDGNAYQANLWKRFVGFGFRLLYHELAWCYDLVAWLVSFGQWNAWTQTVLPHLVGKRILELGHGPGGLIVSMAEKGFQPVALDASPQMTCLARRRLKRAKLTLNLVRGHAQKLPFVSNSFDSVVATFPTTFISNPATAAEVARILRPGGKLAVVLGARLSSRDPLSRLIEWLYLITGQRGTEDARTWAKPFIGAGLTVQWIQIKLRRSQVFLIVAERSMLNDRDRRNNG